MLSLVLALALASAQTPGLERPRGQLIAAVPLGADPSQSYALYLPSAYTTSRVWPVILAFDAGGRGRTAVDRYQVAAERYGYIVVGSNNSRNGNPETGKIVAALGADVQSRFAIDPKRIYTAGMSGGARVALSIALLSNGIAGVMASSAGYPDSRPRESVPFPIFATAGTEDFNYLEMRELDRPLRSPHRLAVFEGGHTWLSSELAIEAVEWMEIQAIKSGLAPPDDAKVREILSKRLRAAEAQSPGSLAAALAFRHLVDDFEGLVDVTALAVRADALAKDGRVRAAERRDRDELARERNLVGEVLQAERQLVDADARMKALMDLRRLWKDLSDKAKRTDDSPDRRLARRVLGNLAASATTKDTSYLEIIAMYRMVRR